MQTEEGHIEVKWVKSMKALALVAQRGKKNCYCFNPLLSYLHIHSYIFKHPWSGLIVWSFTLLLLSMMPVVCDVTKAKRYFLIHEDIKMHL